MTKKLSKVVICISRLNLATCSDPLGPPILLEYGQLVAFIVFSHVSKSIGTFPTSEMTNLVIEF